MEFLFDYGILLIHLLCLLLFINSCTSLLVVPSHASTNFLIKRKEKEKKINNNLAVFGCVMIVQLVAHSTPSPVKYLYLFSLQLQPPLWLLLSPSNRPNLSCSPYLTSSESISIVMSSSTPALYIYVLSIGSECS